MKAYRYPPLWAYTLAVLMVPIMDSYKHSVKIPVLELTELSTVRLLRMDLVFYALVFLCDLLIFLMISRRMGKDWRRWLLLGVLFVFAMPYVGVHWSMFEAVAVFLSLCAILLLSHHHYLAGGFMFAVSALNKQWTLPAMLLILFALFASRMWKQSIAYLKGISLFPLVCTPFYAASPEPFLEHAILYEENTGIWEWSHDGCGLWGFLWNVRDLGFLAAPLNFLFERQFQFFLVTAIVLVLALIHRKNSLSMPVWICFMSSLMVTLLSPQVYNYYLLVPMIYGVYLYSLSSDSSLLIYLLCAGLLPNLCYLSKIVPNIVLTGKAAVVGSGILAFAKGLESA